jgi:hypothetical protein
VDSGNMIPAMVLNTGLRVLLWGGKC